MDKSKQIHVNQRFLMVLVIGLLCTFVKGDYDCLCNYKVETQVFPTPDSTGTPIGYLYEFDCKAIYGPLQNGYSELEFEHQIGYVKIEEQIETQTCQGDIPDSDKVTTSAPTTVTTTPKFTTTKITTPIPTTTTTTTPATTTTQPVTTTMTTTTPKPTTTTTITTTKPTTPMTSPPATTKLTTEKPTTNTPLTTISTYQHMTTTVKIPEGHTELCPKLTKEDINRNHGFLGQYGEYCYEYVPYHTQWKNAERHCHLVSGGHLATILHQREQDFMLRFLKSHNHHDNVWIGLTDSASEGTWQWSSGACGHGHALKFTNFQTTYHSHSNYNHTLFDCVVLQSDGQWIDVPCGVQLFLGGGFGESHAYICQYNLTATPPELFNGYIAHYIVG